MHLAIEQREVKAMDEQPQDVSLERKKGLHRKLERRQLTMIAIGGAIGNGLFLGSGFAVSLAGPGVIISNIEQKILSLTGLL